MNTRKYIPYDREESLDISETDEEQLYAESLGSSKFKSAATSYRSPRGLEGVASLEKTSKAVFQDSNSKAPRLDKGIKINDYLNETRERSLKGEQALQARDLERFERPLRQKADEKSYHQNEIEKLKASLLADESNRDSAASLKGQLLRGNFETQSPARELSAFEKANIRKNQQQRESTLYAMMSRSDEIVVGSPQLLVEGPQQSKEEQSTTTTKFPGIKSFNFDKETLFKLAKKLEIIESDLEQIRKNGDPQSIEEERILSEKVEFLRSELERGFEKLQEQRDKSLPKQRSTGDNGRSRREKKVTIKEDKRDIDGREEDEQTYDDEVDFEYSQNQSREGMSKSKTRKSHGLSSCWKGLTKEQREIELYEEIENLRTENQQLRTTLKNKENYEFALEDKYQDSKYNLSNVNFEKEKELL